MPSKPTCTLVGRRYSSGDRLDIELPNERFLRMFDKSTIDKVIANTTFALVLVGLLLFVIGAAGGWPDPLLRINELGWRVALAAMGGIIAGFGVLLIWRERNRNKPQLDQDYGLKIVSLQDGQDVGEELDVHGTYQKRPPNGSVKLFIKSPRTGEHWPETTKITFKENTWHGRVQIGGKAGRKRIVEIAVMGEAGQVLCEYYEKVGKDTGEWPGIVKMPSDIYAYDSKLVIRGDAPERKSSVRDKKSSTFAQ